MQKCSSASTTRLALAISNVYVISAVASVSTLSASLTQIHKKSLIIQECLNLFGDFVSLHHIEKCLAWKYCLTIWLLLVLV